MNNKTFDFFLSYSRDADNEIVNELVCALESYGFSIWRDKEEVILGYDIDEGLYKTLNECKSWSGMLTIIDSTYLIKDWCLREIDYAIENDIPIYPILLFLTKQDLPTKYEKLKKFNLCTIRNKGDFNYVIYKIINRFITDYQANIQLSKGFSQNLVLNNLVNAFNTENKNSEDIVFTCDNIAMCINYLLADTKQYFCHKELIMYNLIHNSVKEYFISGSIHRLQLKIITKATSCLLDKYYYS